MGTKSNRCIRTNGTEIRRLRQQSGQSRNRFAATLGISASTLKRAESGSEISPDTLEKIAAKLEIPPRRISALKNHRDQTPPPQFPPHFRTVLFEKITSASDLRNSLLLSNFGCAFDLDPTEELGELVAQAIDSIHDLDNSWRATDSGVIRCIGRTNTLIEKLSEKGVFLHERTFQKHDIESAKNHHGQDVYRISSHIILTILISEDSRESISKEIHTGPSIEECRAELRTLEKKEPTRKREGAPAGPG
jgi:transcriptional regulator with XRE-family HTH domain